MRYALYLTECLALRPYSFMETKEMYCRGKRIDCDMWEYGYLVDDIYGAKYPMIIYSSEYNDGNNIGIDYNFVRGETVGWYTGLIDKNNIMIYEGDIVKAFYKPSAYCNDDPSYAIGSVIYENGIFKIRVYISKNAVEYKVFEKENVIAYSIEHNFLDRSYIIEVIGNIYDNPELLEE